MASQTAGSTWIGRRALGGALPLAAIGAMALAVRTDVAARHPAVAAMLFLWIAADSLTLGLIARERRPAPRTVVAALAGAATATWLLSPAVLRAALLDRPWLCAPMLAVVAAHAAVRLWRAGGIVRREGWRRAGAWHGVAAEFVPAPVLALALKEVRLVHLALFRWNAAPDVPAGARGFAYHRHLQPVMIALLLLSLVEIAVTHLLVAHWSRVAATVILVASEVSLIYLIGLIKSLRLRPVLVTADGVRVRAGILIDRLIPFTSIVAVDGDPAGETVKAPDTLNAALLAWPNLLIRLAEPLPRRGLWRPRPPIAAIALRLDDPVEFARLVRWRCGIAA